MNKEAQMNWGLGEVAADTLVIRCFGGLSVSLGTNTIPSSAWRGRGAKILFVYLVLNGPTPREKLMELGWPERDPDVARDNLNSMLRYARRALETRHRAGREFIVYNNPFYAF